MAKTTDNSLRAAAANPWSGSAHDGLTLDQAVIAKVVLDDFMLAALGQPVAKAGEGDAVPGESVLRSLLYVEWGTGAEAAVEKALAKIAAGTGTVTETELASVMKLIDKTLATEFVDPVEGKLPAIMKRWYKKAKKGIVAAAAADIAEVWQDVDNQVTAWLGEHHMYWVRNYYDKHLSDALAKHVTAGMSEGLGRSAIGDSLAEFFTDYPGVGHQPLSYWRGFAANGMNRTRQFGMTQAWQDIGVSELVVMAVMDERTSPICREMDGRIIPVQRCADQRDLLVAAEDPEDVKTIAPWLSKKQLGELTGKSTKAFMNQGVVTPPYHFHCRTTLVER